MFIGAILDAEGAFAIKSGAFLLKEVAALKKTKMPPSCCFAAFRLANHYFLR